MRGGGEGMSHHHHHHSRHSTAAAAVGGGACDDVMVVDQPPPPAPPPSPPAEPKNVLMVRQTTMSSSLSRQGHRHRCCDSKSNQQNNHDDDDNHDHHHHHPLSSRPLNVENKIVNLTAAASSAADQHHPLLGVGRVGGEQKTVDQRSVVVAREDDGRRRSASFWTRRSMLTTIFVSLTLLFGAFSLFNANSNDDSRGGVDDLLGEDDITQLISDDDAKGYLNRYGYTASISSSNEQPAGEPRVYAQQQHRKSEDLVGDLTLDSIRSAVRKFQEFAGLPTTGDLDNKTRKKMAQPRCGIQDVQMLTSGDYVMKWRKRRVTYQLMHSTDDIPERMQKQAIQMAFDTWSKVVPLDFTEATGFDTPDVKVLFARRSHGDPWPFDGRGGVLAHATFPQDGKLHFDDDENWVFMDGRKIGNHRFTDLYWVALHEIGHVLGLSHSNIETAIMAPFYQDPRDLVDWRGNYKMPELTQYDVRAVQQIYGKRYGRLDTSADRSHGIPTVGGRRKSDTYDDRDESFWKRLGKLFSTEDDNAENNNRNHLNDENGDDHRTHGRQGRNHARRDHQHHRHNYEEMENSSTKQFAKLNLVNLISASFLCIIMARLLAMQH